MTTAAVFAALLTVLGLATTASGSLPTPTPTPPGAESPAAGPHPLVAPADAGREPAAPQTQFVAVAPCRVADTRAGGGLLSGARAFYIAGSFGFAPQGGKAGGCGIPVGAAAVAANITTTGAAGNGYLTGYASGQARPLSNFISYGKTATVTANPVLPLTAVSTQQLALYASVATQVIIDVTGYYTQQFHALVYVSGSGSSIYSGSSHAVSVADVNTGVANVTFDRDVSYCSVAASADLSGHYAMAFTFQDTSKVELQTWTLNSTGQTVPTNGYVYLLVSC